MKPWPTYKNRSSVFGRDLHFLTPEARGIERKRLTDAKVTAFKTGGPLGCLCLCRQVRQHAKA